MKTAISLPDAVFRAVDAQAKRLKISRSEFFVRAVVRLLADQDMERIRASYDEAFAEGLENAQAASFRRSATRHALLAVEWNDESTAAK